MGRLYVEPKIPLLAIILTLIVPGLGHLYAQSFRRGMIFLGITAAALIPPVVFIFSSAAKSNVYLLLPVPVMMITAAFIATDAWREARRFNTAWGVSGDIRVDWP